MQQLRKRELNTGKYTFTDSKKLCICGHTLGDHCATRIKTGNGYEQDCMVSTWEPFIPCNCQCFTPANNSKKKE